jgi:hypothetical protein
MKSIWQITIEDYLNIVEMAQKNGKKSGESMEEEFLEYMKLKNKKSIGHTELNKEELIKEVVSHDKKVLNFWTDKDGKMIVEIHKKKDENEKTK